MPRKLKADLLLVCCSLIWGATFVLVKDALADASVFVFLALRFLIATAVLALLYGRELRRVGASGWRAGGSSGGAHSLEEWYDPAGREIGMQRVLLTLLQVAGLNPPTD